MTDNLFKFEPEVENTTSEHVDESVKVADFPEIQEYMNFLFKVESQKVPFVTPERIDKNYEKYCEAMNTFMVYPDIFSDVMVPEGSVFSMFFAQRVVLRAMARYRQSFFTFTRAFSKSFLASFKGYQKCMFVPRSKVFVVAGTKSQAAQIAREKIIDDLWVKFPLMANEMQKFRRGGKLKDPFIDSGDSVQFNFSNGSIYDVIGGKMRGGRRTEGIFEEVIDQDPTYINETVIPLLNTTRTDIKGRVNPKEPQKTKIFITTAGYQQTFAYDKCKETLIHSTIRPDLYFCMGGSYKTLLLCGRMAREDITELVSSPSYLPESFDREYKSIWSNAVAGATFNANDIVKMRKIQKAEFKSSEAYMENGDFYVISADLAYDGAAETAVVVARVSPGEYSFKYRFINAFTIEGNFEKVSNVLKDYANIYDARMIVYDANGVGAPLREWLNKTTEYDGVIMDGLGIINPPPKVEGIKTYRGKHRNVCYEIKSGGQKGSTIHKTFFSKMRNGNVRFLIKASAALSKFETQKSFVEASSRRKDSAMRPYKYSDLMEKQFRNLNTVDTLDHTSGQVKIERRDKNIQKDFFSACEYLVHAVTEYIEVPYFKDRKDKKLKQKKLSFTTEAFAKDKPDRSNRRRR